MGGKRGGEVGGGGSKKAQGQARKADAAAAKSAAEEAKRAAAEAAEWDKGAKGAGKKEAEAAKRAEQARKKAELQALAAEDERSTPGRAAPKNSKSAAKKTAAPSRGLDLSQLEGAPTKLTTLNASGIDNALDALSIDAGGAAAAGGVDRHPERRFKAAYAAFEERRLAEMDEDGSGKGLRLNQRKDKVRKEFEKSPENPFNQVTARFDATKDELAQIRSQEKAKIETRLK